MNKIEELKQLIQVLPSLEREMEISELIYLRQRDSNTGVQENGFVYHVSPTVEKNYFISRNEYEQANKRRWELIEELGLSASIDGIPDFEESKIKPYGIDYELRNLNDNDLPIGRP